MPKIKIYGAGSIGNHLAHAYRLLGWDVTIVDKDSAALERTKTDIYPSRYGSWDEEIKLFTLNNQPNEKYDVIMIGTPPNSHLPIAIKVVKEENPKILIIEKPLCTPTLDGAQELYASAKENGVIVLVGYNHTLTKNTIEAQKILKEINLGDISIIESGFKEYWGGIFKAHPWLSGPEDTYLGFSSKGGGASGEHSHAVNIWQHFVHFLGFGRVTEVSATMDIVKDEKVDYDRICNFSLRTDKGFYGTAVQDVVTEPTVKYLRIQGSNGFLKWDVNFDSNHDSIIHQINGGEVQTNLIKKERVDDFNCEAEHISKILSGEIKPEDSPVLLDRGLDTMMVIAAAHRSNKEKRAMKIDYSKGYTLDAISPID